MAVGGKATKRSRYGSTIEDQVKRTLEATKIVAEAGLRLHLIDAEWRINDVPPSELENLLNSFPTVRTIVTVAARRRDAEQILKLYIPLIEEAGNAGLCIVPGNNIYLDDDERGLNPYKSVKKILDQAYRRVSRILLGVEGLEGRLDEIVKTYPEVKLFFLYDEEKLGDLQLYSSRGVQCGVYVPYAIDLPELDVVKSLLDYALRRRWFRDEASRVLETLDPSRIELSRLPPDAMSVLAKGVSRLCVYGTLSEVLEKLRKIRSCGASFIVGLPLRDTPEQVHAFSSCLKSM
ncbi:MAG: hypothetical protein DRJ68_03785 [Thermoprotei archaeon]|nr:MAG: hypothetical protein DRJ68_03785 [Thermoprotei archaeon]